MNYDLNLPAPKPQISYAKLAKSVTMGTIVALFSTVLLLMILAAVVNAAFGDPDRVLHIFTCAGASAGALLGGFRASRLNGSNGLVAGLSTGVSVSIIIFIVMLFASEPAAAGAGANAGFRLIMTLCNILFAGVGGVCAVNAGSRKTGGYSSRKK